MTGNNQSPALQFFSSGIKVHSNHLPYFTSPHLPTTSAKRSSPRQATLPSKMVIKSHRTLLSAVMLPATAVWNWRKNRATCLRIPQTMPCGESASMAHYLRQFHSITLLMLLMQVLVHALDTNLTPNVAASQPIIRSITASLPSKNMMFKSRGRDEAMTSGHAKMHAKRQPLLASCAVGLPWR